MFNLAFFFSLNTKLQSIGVPPNIAGGMTDGAEEIPLPMDMPGNSWGNFFLFNL